MFGAFFTCAAAGALAQARQTAIGLLFPKNGRAASDNKAMANRLQTRPTGEDRAKDHWQSTGERRKIVVAG
jgi:hypothetical protein